MMALSFALLVLAACQGEPSSPGDSGEDMDGGARTDSGDEGGTQADSGDDGGQEEVGCGEPTISDTVPSHATEIQSIWSSRCSTCHTSSANGGLSLSNAYDKIVDQPSDDLPGMDLVEPGDLDRSYLWLKLTDGQDAVGGDGDWMPRGGQELTAEECDRIATWIAGGAPP